MQQSTMIATIAMSVLLVVLLSSASLNMYMWQQLLLSSCWQIIAFAERFRRLMFLPDKCSKPSQHAQSCMLWTLEQDVIVLTHS